MIKKTKIAFAFFLFGIVPHSSYSSADPLPPRMGEGGTIFSYEAPDVNALTLAGEFNQWNMTANPLSKDPATGVWSVLVPLGEGKYKYKFIIDGQWMSGDDLVVEVKKDAQGKLFIPEIKVKAGPNTAYSSKIRLGGNLIGTMHHRHFADENRYRLDKPRFHIDLDFDVNITQEMSGFLRTEMDSFETNQVSLNLFKSHLDVAPEWFNLRLFNNEKNVQLEDPLRLTDKEVSVRYDEIEWVDRPNPNRAIGLKAQGLNVTISPWNWFDLRGFYLDKSNADRTLNFFDSQADNFVEDNWGLRVKRSFGEILALGISHFARAGIKWPYADANNYFPDPGLAQGHTFRSSIRHSNLSDGLPAEFFKGWRDQSSTALDFKFRALPGFWIFGEYLFGSEALKAVRRNDRRSLDLASDARWKLYDQNQFLSAAQFRWQEEVTLEAFWSRREITLGKVLHTNQTSESNVKGQRYGAKAMVERKKVSFGLEIAQEKTDPFSGGTLYMDPGVIPTMKQFRFSNFVSSVPFALLDGDLNLRPYLKLDFGDQFSGRIFGNFHRYGFRSSTASFTTAQANPALVPSFTVENYELIADYLAKIHGPFFLQGSIRFARFADKDYYNASGVFFSAYTAILYKLKKNIYVRLGWGVDPEGFDEDLKEDFDLREQFLYNRFTEAIGKGENVSQAIVSAEKSLEAEKRISLRVEIRF